MWRDKKERLVQDSNQMRGEISFILILFFQTIGWGFDQKGHPTEELMQAKMPIVSQQQCLWSYPEFFAKFTSNYTFCAGFINGEQFSKF